MSKKTIIIIMFSVLSVWVTQIAKAAVIHVTTVQDNVSGSLRAAITTSNSNNENNTIYLPAGVYFLSGASEEDANAGGDLDINTGRKLTIIGSGKTKTDIDGQGLDRVLHILNGTVTLIDLTIRKGKARYKIVAKPLGDDGGGIYNCANLTMIRCVIRENAAGDGSWWHGNGTSGGNGGGIYNSGTLVMENCIISNNKGGDGTEGDDEGGNGGSGGGIYNIGMLTFNECTITGNRAGKGAWFEGIGGDGGGICNGGTLILSGCTVSNNMTGSGDYTGGKGGGIFNSVNASLRLINSTLSGNQTGERGGGLYNDGDSRLTGVTIVNNRAGIDSDPYLEYGGGGIYNNGSIRLKNSITAYNWVPYAELGPDCYGTFDWVSYSFIADTADCILTGFQKANILGQDPLLGPLTDNGGPTQTHALLPGSPAIDAGNSSDFLNDQRGYPRPVDIPGIANVSDGADIGAYEFNTSYAISGKIIYNGSGIPGVTLTFSNNGGSTITESDGHYSHTVLYNWSGAVNPAKEGYTFNPSSRNYASVTANLSNQDFTAAKIPPPQIFLNHTQLYFGAHMDGNQTGPQKFLITNSGGGILNWTAGVGADAAWLTCTPQSGTGFAEVTVTVSPIGLLPGTYTAGITIQSPNAVNSPQTVAVQLVVKEASQGQAPFGAFDSPVDGATVSGSIPVSGWALDDMEVDSVKIYRDALTGEGGGQVYIGDAVLVEGARPDVVRIYPDIPFNYRAGWGYMLLTNLLPGQGNGTFTLYAKATDKEGNAVTLGTKTIIGNNAQAVKPFGAIDTPAQGGTASGAWYANFGWALTPLPNTIPIDGSTINVWVDGLPLGHPVYNIYRQDIASLFPGLNNSDGAVGYYYLDSTKYLNGVHTIAWTVTDNVGNAEGIGSRYFTIQNTGGDLSRRGEPACSPVFDSSSPSFDSSSSISNQYGTVRVKKGFNVDIEANEVYPDEEGVIHIEIRELERVEIHLSPGTINISPLPIGSTLDSREGIFYWQPGPGFIGDYEFLFLAKASKSETVKTPITVKINPKSY